MIWSIVAISLELAALVAIGYTLRYTVRHRSGLNEPEKLKRIWSRSEEIRFQPVFKSMIFSIGVGQGAPAILGFLVSFVLVLLGLSGQYLVVSVVVVSSAVFFMCAMVGPMVYHASGGQRTSLNVLSLLFFNLTMLYLGIYEPLVQVIDEQKTHQDKVIFWISYGITPILMIALQIPFALWGAARKFPSAARIYSTNPVPDWVRLNRTIGLAAVPLIVVRMLTLGVHLGLGYETYLDRVANFLADAMLYSTTALAAVISVNRALLAEDFRWQWRSFLTPAVPLGVVDIFVTLTEGLLVEPVHPFTGLYLIIQQFTIYGAAGSLGAYLYLYLAQQHAQGQLGELNQSVGDGLLDSDNEEAETL